MNNWQAVVNYTDFSRKAWMILPLGKPAHSLKLWQRSGAAANDELQSVYHKRCTAGYIQAADYIEFVLKNPKAADDLLEETDQKINALLPFPAEHPIVEDRLLSSWGIRFIQIKNYLAFYVAEENQVTIIRFLYAKSNWISILKSGIPLL